MCCSLAMLVNGLIIILVFQSFVSAFSDLGIQGNEFGLDYSMRFSNTNTYELNHGWVRGSLPSTRSPGEL